METNLDLRPYARAIARSWRLILGLPVVAAVLAYSGALVLPAKYQAVAIVSVAAPRFSLRLDDIEQNTAEPVRSYAELALADQVLTATLDQSDQTYSVEARQLGRLRNTLRAAVSADGTLLTLTVSDTDPARAQALANAWAEVFVARARTLYGLNAESIVVFEDALAKAQVALEGGEAALTAFLATNNTVLARTHLNSLEAQLYAALAEAARLEAVLQNGQDLSASLARRDAAVPAGALDQLAALQLTAQATTNSELAPAPGNTRPTRSSATPSDGVTNDVQVQVQTGPASSPPIQVQYATGDQTQTLGDLRVALDRMIEALRARIAYAETRAQRLEPLLQSAQGQVADLEAQEAQLRREVAIGEQQYLHLNNQVREARIAALAAENLAQIASYAALPTQQSGLAPWQIAALGAAGGLLLAAAVVLARTWWTSES